MKRFCTIIFLIGLFWVLASCSLKEDLPKDTTDRTVSASQVIETTQSLATESATQLPTTEPSATVPTATQPQIAEPGDADFVRVLDYIPDLVLDLKYATTDNFTGVVIYDSDEAWLRYGTVKKLMQVQAELNTLGYGLKLWDGFRPSSAQFKLWEICPNPTYVSNPNNGFSNHSRGNTVDITLVDMRSNELEMPTGFDDFSALADRNYSDCSSIAADNARLLEEIMEKHGFKGYYGEWWHYTDTDSYDVEQKFIP